MNWLLYLLKSYVLKDDGGRNAYSGEIKFYGHEMALKGTKTIDLRLFDLAKLFY